MVDFVSHALWAYVLFHHQADMAAYAFFSVFPDLVWAVPSIFLGLASGSLFERFKGWRKASRADRFQKMQEQPHFSMVRTLYRVAHSWLLMSLVAAILWAVRPELMAPFVGGVFLHLGMDLFLHKESPFGQYPFFPVFNYAVDGVIHWSDRRVLAANFAALVLALALIFFRYL